MKYLLVPVLVFVLLFATPAHAQTANKFNIGDRVQTTTKLNVRSSPNGRRLGAQAAGAQGTVIGGPVYSKGYYWYQIDYDKAPDGWSVQDYLVDLTTPTPTPSPSPAPTLSLSASPSSVLSGGSTTLTWSSTNATSCTASGAWSGSEPTSGSQSVVVNSSSTYTLSCSGSGGSVTQNAYVTVTITTSGGAPYLVPGSGPVGTTTQPAAVGTPGTQGYDEPAISAWDVIPKDVVETDRNVGVVAYHLTGIQYVMFSANGGPWVEVNARSLNPETNVEEYYARLRASDYADGPIELRAIAVPNTGVPKVLPIIMLYGNYNHTLPRPVEYVSTTGSDATGDGTLARPFASIVKAGEMMSNPNGGTIYLLPGDYSFTHFYWYDNIPNSDAFVTITAAPGYTKDQVRITTGTDGGISSNYVHLSNLTVFPNAIVGGFNTAATNVVWIDNCIMHGTFDQAQVWDPWTANYVTYITDSTASNTDLGISGYLLRNDHLTQSWSQGITGTITALNVDVHNIYMGPYTYVHPDVDHMYGMDQLQKDNVGMIRYNVQATDNINARGDAGSAQNMVYDKTNMTEVSGGWGYIISMGGWIDSTAMTKTTQNVLFIDSNFNGPATWNESPTLYTIIAKDVLFKNTLVNGATSMPSNPTWGGPTSGVIVDPTPLASAGTVTGNVAGEYLDAAGTMSQLDALETALNGLKAYFETH